MEVGPKVEHFVPFPVHLGTKASPRFPASRTVPGGRPGMTKGAKVRNVAGWLLQILMAVAFVGIGLAKFGDPAWERNFARWGYPAGFHLVIGAVEFLLGVLLIVPKLTSYAALGLAAVMAGAVATHATAGQAWTRPLPHLTLFLILAALRWPRRWRPNAERGGAAPDSPAPRSEAEPRWS